MGSFTIDSYEVIKAGGFDLISSKILLFFSPHFLFL